jgi:hypothetical protein
MYAHIYNNVCGLYYIQTIISGPTVRNEVEVRKIPLSNLIYWSIFSITGTPN